MQRILNFYPAHGLDSYTGYGRMELGIAKGLQESEVRVLLYPDLKYPMLMVNSSLQLLDVPHVKNTRLWAFNMIETNRVDPAWVDALNRTCERVLVPCPPMIDIYRDSGVTVPIDYVPLGVDLFASESVFESLIQYQSDLTGDEETFVFLTYSYGDIRKGGDIAIKAFETAFGGDKRYRLIVKAREGYQSTWLADVHNPQIEIIGGRQSETDWLSLQHQSHCFVFPSRGEGWGMPPRELTLAGVPTIATQWLGMWDIEEWGIPLHYEGMSLCEFVDYQANAVDAEWSEPNIDHLISQMEWVANHYTEAKKIAQNGRSYLLQHFSWKHIGKRLNELATLYG